MDREERNRGRDREGERESATERREQNPTESAEHRMAEGMVGWIQLLGEQYCLAVIVCSSTCSGFPGLGPRAHHITVSRYTTIFCLPTITPTTTKKTKTRRRMKMRTTMTRTMLLDRSASSILASSGDESIFSNPYFISMKHEYESNRVILTFRYIRAADRTIFFSVRAASRFLAASGADGIPTWCSSRSPARNKDGCIYLSFYPPTYLSLYLFICIYLHLSIDSRRYPSICSRPIVHLSLLTRRSLSFDVLYPSLMSQKS